MSVNKTLPTYFIRNDGVDKMRIATIFVSVAVIFSYFITNLQIPR